MANVTQLKTRVLPGQKIEVPAPDFPVGETVEVVVVWSETNHAVGKSALELLDSLPGQQVFRTPEEADSYLPQERDTWDR